MDKSERELYKPIPEGHIRVKDGEIQPTDMCLSVFQGVWLRADSPMWLNPATRAEEAFMVARPLVMASMIDQIYGGAR